MDFLRFLFGEKKIEEFLSEGKVMGFPKEVCLEVTERLRKENAANRDLGSSTHTGNGDWVNQTVFEDSNMRIEFKKEGVLKKQMDESVWELVVRQLYKGRIPAKQEEQDEAQSSSADSNNLRAEMKNKMIDLVIHHLDSEDFDDWSSDLYEDGVVFDDADMEITLKDDLLGKVKEAIIAIIKKHLHHADSDRWNPKLDYDILFEDDELIITIEEDEELSDKIKQAMADIIAKAWG